MRIARGFGATLLAATLLAAGLVLGPVGAAPARAADDGLDLVTKATYTLAQKAGVVHVSVIVNATNNKPNLVEKTPNGTRTTRYFYERATLVIQREATKIRASTGGTRLTVTPQDNPAYKVVDVAFRADLFYHQKTSFRLDFDLPGGAPRSSGDIRVGLAFATFYAWAFGDRGDVRIVLPAGFVVSKTGSPLATSVTGGATTYFANGITDVIDWYAVIVADRHSELTQDHIDLAGGEHLIVRAWPEDKEWETRVGEVLRTGLPTLVDLVGLDWPVTGEIEVAEVHTPLLEGYAGVFHVGEDRIEISEDLDELTIIHEASHAWFNSGLFVGRWIEEGFADEYASLVLDKISTGGFAPDPIDPEDAGNVRLNEWVHPGRIADEATNLREQFGYDASWTVIRALVSEIGVDRMRAVIAAAADEQIPYVGAGSPERLDGAADWRRFLDLLEGVGGSRSATDLFDRWVVLDPERTLLVARTEARTAYESLLETGAGWLPGIAVRMPMADWDFATAQTQMEAALGILGTRGRISALAKGVGVTPPKALRIAYEGATDLASVGALADTELATLQTIATAKATVAATTRDMVTAVGLLGADPSADLASAMDSFGAGDNVAATAAATRAEDLIAGAPAAGRGRLVAGSGVVIGGGLIAVGSTVMLRRRRMSELAGAGEAAPAVAPEPPDAPDSYATLGAPPAEVAGEGPVAPPGEEEQGT